MDLKNSLNVDGSITASGRLGGGEQAVSAGVLGSRNEAISLNGTFDLISSDLIVTDEPLTGSSVPSSYVKIIDL